MANPWEFLSRWADENANATGYDDESTAKRLAAECLEAAKSAGIGAAAVIKAAGGNLVDFMSSAIDSATNREVDRLASKD